MLKYLKSTRYEFNNRFIIKKNLLGLCLKSNRYIKKGKIIGEYKGEILDEEEFEFRYQNIYKPNNLLYTFQTSRGNYIDATYSGNYTRYIEHSCDPNCEVIEKYGRILIKTKKRIKKGDFISISYVCEPSTLDDYTFICQCKNNNCLIYI